jgi:general stress protein 26
MSDDSDRTARLRGDRNLWFCSVRPDGRAHVAPVWFVHVADRFWIATGASSTKVANLATQPTVTLALEDGNALIVVEGTAVVHATERPADVSSAFSEKYGWDVRRHDDPDIGVIALVEVTVERWVFGGPGHPGDG